VRRVDAGEGASLSAMSARPVRVMVAHTVALAVVFGGLTAYIASIQQIVFDTFHAAQYLPLVFAAIAAPMSLASWYNSRVVTQFGLRHVGHLGVVAFSIVAVAHASIASAIDEPLWLFVLMQAMVMSAFAFTSANLSTLAMENMAPIAGTASSAQGVIGTIGGASISCRLWPFRSGVLKINICCPF